MFTIRDLIVVNEAKANVPILTGVGYLDHMIDQFNSHAQIGVGLTVLFNDNDSNDANDDENSSRLLKDNRNRLAINPKCKQSDLFSFVGRHIGTEIKKLVSLGDNSEITNDEEPPPPTKKVRAEEAQQHQRESRFCCPLDEALVECVISSSSNEGKLIEYSLEPYGLYPSNKGREHIGHLETSALVEFWNSLSISSGLDIKLKKHRGDNGHHIVESSFKAFSRALRNYIDNSLDMWNDPNSPNNVASIELQREGKIERSTKETSIKVHLLLNGKSDETNVNTGIPILDEFFTLLAKEAQMTLQIECVGDLWVDDHHTAEDVSIAVGQCLTQALGTKAGLNRMWVANASIAANDNNESASANAEVTMDLSNRPCMIHNLDSILQHSEYVDGDGDDIGDNNTSSPLSCEMFVHVLESLVMNGRMTVHVVDKNAAKSDGDNDNDGGTAANNIADAVRCTAMAFGRALRVCAMVDCRRAGQTASSKGTLSV